MGGPSSRPSTRRYPFVWRKGVLNGYSSTRVSLWDSLMFGRLAMGFANVRAGTRVLMLVLVQAYEHPFVLDVKVPVERGSTLLGFAIDTVPGASTVARLAAMAKHEARAASGKGTATLAKAPSAQDIA